jgi:hypothetical protein
MKFYLIIFLCFFIASCDSKQEDPVRVKIKYTPTLDSVCTFFSGENIKDEWKKELLIKKQELEHEWENIGSKLISTAEEITGKNFERRKNNVYLTLCNTPSRSSPLILNMRYSLTSFTENPVSTQYKIGTLFHELMHPYISEHLPKSVPSLEAYKNEHSRVLEHIHLLALQKAVYLHLKLDHELSLIVQIDSSLPNSYYKRSWEIVNSSENYYKELIAELATP